MRSSTTFTLSATKYTHMAVGLAGFGNDAVYRYKESVYLIPTDRFIESRVHSLDFYTSVPAGIAVDVWELRCLLVGRLGKQL